MRSSLWIVVACAALLASACNAAVSPDWDPDSLAKCAISRDTVIDNMLSVFDVYHTGRFPGELLDCIWYNTTTVADSLKWQIPGGPADIMLYCDIDKDGWLDVDEIRPTPTQCVGNCPTANSVAFFYTQARNNDEWKEVCGHLLQAKTVEEEDAHQKIRIGPKRKLVRLYREDLL